MKSKLYTKTGDKGETSLVSGERVLKSDQRVELYGEVDELNSHLGHLRSLLDKSFGEDDQLLEVIQNAMFTLGSNLACGPEKRDEYKLPQLTEEVIQGLEKRIDELDSKVPALKNFILPTGPSALTYTHVCRSFTRRVERHAVAVGTQAIDYIPAHMVQFLNRLADYLFVFARWVGHHQSAKEVIWSP